MKPLPLALRFAPLGALALVLAACSGPPDEAMEAGEEETVDCDLASDGSGDYGPMDGAAEGPGDGSGGGQAGMDYANCGVVGAD